MAGRPVPWYRDRRGTTLVGLYAVLALFGGLITTGLIFPDVVTRRVAAGGATSLAIPLPLFLYAALGAFAYVFVVLSSAPDADAIAVGRLGLRVPAALLVVTGVFLFGEPLGVDPAAGTADAARELAGIAFLAGFFVEHALKGLRAVSARLYPGDPSDLYDSPRRDRDREG